MPKKMGINSKAVEARERKQAVKTSTKEKAAKEAEDRLWEDDNKSLAKKKVKKEEEERKKLENARKKAEDRMLLEKEIASIKVRGKSVQKITQKHIQDEVEKRNRAVEQMNAAKLEPKISIESEIPLEENYNREMSNTNIATNVDEAIAVLSVNDGEDKHPEKRMRAAFKAYEEINLARIKLENPTLRMSQWKQILVKDWNKAPENPYNQHF